MATLTGLYISQSYGGIIHLSTNVGISGTTPTQLQDGVGNNMGVWFNGAGNVSASSFTGLASNATSASYAVNATSANSATTATSASYSNNSTSASYSNNSTSASYALVATSASYALNATSASYALTASFAANVPATASYATNADLLDNKDSSTFATTGSNTFVGNQIITGSLTLSSSAAINGNLNLTGSLFNRPTGLNIASSTASLDFNNGSIFTLTLPNSAVNTHISASNLRPGASAALQITQGLAATATVTFASTFTFPSGSSYTAFASSSANDVITLISFDGSIVRAVAANNFI